MSRDALPVQGVFPYCVTYTGRNRDWAFRSFFCCKKPHLMTHWADN